MVHRHPCLPAPADGRAGLDAAGKAILQPHTGGNVHIAAPAGQLHGLQKQALVPVDVGGDEMLGGDLRLLQDLQKRRQPCLAGAHVELHHTCFSGEYASQPGLGQDPLELVLSGLGGAMVGDGHLADTQNLVDDDNVPAGVGEDSIERHLVGAGEHIGGNALGVQGPGLGQEGLQVAGGAVGAQNAHQGGDAGGGHGAQLHLRGTAVGPGLPASADDVDVLVHIAGDHRPPGGVNDLPLQAGDRGEGGTHLGHLLPDYQNILPPHRLRGVQLSIFNQQIPGHSFSPRRSAWRCQSQYSRK